MAVPVTSVSLLKVLGEDAQSPRWTEFAKLYASTIDGFLFKYFPQVDAGEVVNETLAALVEKLPLYEYDHDTKGHFRNYLIGIVRFKAIEQLKRHKRDADLRAAIETKAKLDWEYERQSYSVDLRDWQKEAGTMSKTGFRTDSMRKISEQLSFTGVNVHISETGLSCKWQTPLCHLHETIDCVRNTLSRDRTLLGRGMGSSRQTRRTDERK